MENENSEFWNFGNESESSNLKKNASKVQQLSIIELNTLKNNYIVISRNKRINLAQHSTKYSQTPWIHTVAILNCKHLFNNRHWVELCL